MALTHTADLETGTLSSAPQTGATDRQSEARLDSALLARVKDGDQRAAEALFRKYRNRAFAIAYRMSAGDREEALERVQETFLKVFRTIGGFDGKATFYTWFHRILVNTCLDARRSRLRWLRVFGRPMRPESEPDAPQSLNSFPDTGPDASPDARIRADELARDVRQALLRMSPHQRMVITLKCFEDMRVSEIAEVMNLAEGTVKTHLFRATQAMRKHLAHWSGVQGE